MNSLFHFVMMLFQNTGRDITVFQTLMRVVRSLTPKDLIQYMLQIITKEVSYIYKL